MLTEMGRRAAGSSRLRTAFAHSPLPTLASVGRVAGPVGVMQHISGCKASPSPRAREVRASRSRGPLEIMLGRHQHYTPPQTPRPALRLHCTQPQAPRVGSMSCTRSAPGLHLANTTSAPRAATVPTSGPVCLQRQSLRPSRGRTARSYAAGTGLRAAL